MRRAAAAALALLAVPAAAADATYRVRGDHLPVSAVRNGYHQVVTPLAPREVLVQVATEPRPVGAAAARPAGVVAPGVPSDFRLPPELARGVTRAEDAYGAATAVLAWVDRHLRVVPDDPRPQDAAAVIARGGGRCSGLANAAAALLLASGLEARTVSGLLVADDGAVAHRWVEVALPGAGWVPTDPTLGLWVLTPRHLLFDRPVLDPPAVEVLARGPDGIAGLPLRRGRPWRPNHGAALTCHLVGSAGGRVELRGPAGGTRWGSGPGPLEFADLLPGRWTVRLHAEAGASTIAVSLDEGEHASVVLRPALSR